MMRFLPVFLFYGWLGPVGLYINGVVGCVAVLACFFILITSVLMADVVLRSFK